MNIDHYEIWEPVENISNDIYFYDLQYDGRNLIIFLKELKSTNKTLIVKFVGVLDFRLTIESGRLKTIYEVPTFRGFRTSTESEFLRRFKEESRGLFDDDKLVHYLICNIDNIIEIVSGPPVLAEWVTTDY